MVMNVDSDMLAKYDRFIAERHRMWERRILAKEPGPWTDEPILRERRFLNMFRVLDHGSQFVVKNFTREGDEGNLLARALLYRLTNRTDWWEWHKERTSEYPTEAEIVSGAVIDSMTEYRTTGTPLFGSGYMIANNTMGGLRKEEAVVRMVQGILSSLDLDALVGEGFKRAVEILSDGTFKGIKTFLAQQVVIDIGYGDARILETETAFPGPGSIRGATHMFGSADVTAAVDWLYEYQQVTGNTPILSLESGPRRLSKTDIQNSLCEFDKYVRAEERAVRKFTPRSDSLQVTPVFPRHW